MDEFEDDDAAINAPLDVRFVVAGSLMLISGLVAIAFVETRWMRCIGALVLFASFFVMTKKQK